MAKKLLTLAKELDFETEDQYFDYCISSHINGNRSQCESLFKALSKEDKKGLLIYIRQYGRLGHATEIYNYYFMLL